MDRYNELLQRDRTTKGDVERESLFWILANNDDLYGKVNSIYDFKDRSIKPECLGPESEVDLCSGSRRLIKLAYNLYNGYPADVLDTFCGLDVGNYIIAMRAITIRLGK